MATSLPLGSPSPPGFGGGARGGGDEGPTARKAVLVLARRAALFFRVRKPPDLGGNQSKGVYFDTSLRPPFDPKRSNRAGLFKFLAVGCGLNIIAPSAISDVDFGPSGNRNSNESSLCMWFLPWDGIPACHSLQELSLEMLMVTVLFLLKPDRLETYPTRLHSVAP